MRQRILLALFITIPVHAPLPAHAIESGFIAESCAWPEVVRVYSGWGAVPAEDGDAQITCTGVYIGGRTILTAPACVQNPPLPFEILFGDRFGSGPQSGEAPRMSLRVVDCRNHPSLPVAACTLADAPSIQAIPIVAPCEADELLVTGAELFTVGANFDKRWAQSTLTANLPPPASPFQLPPELAWTTQSGLDSTILESEDLGAPLYVRAPDTSLRIAAIAVNTNPAQWLGTWNLTQWLLANEPEDVVLPCHTPAGAWSASPACASLIADRSTGAGAWARGSQVCTATTLVAPSPTCEP